MEYSDNDEIKKGDKVIIKYMEQDAIVVETSGNTCMVSYINENDKEIVETFNIVDLKKC